MNDKLKKLYKQIRKKGLSVDQEKKISLELNDERVHEFPDYQVSESEIGEAFSKKLNDFKVDFLKCFFLILLGE